jgi:hypothetical protein
MCVDNIFFFAAAVIVAQNDKDPGIGFFDLRFQFCEFLLEKMFDEIIAFLLGGSKNMMRAGQDISPNKYGLRKVLSYFLEKLLIPIITSMQVGYKKTDTRFFHGCVVYYIGSIYPMESCRYLVFFIGHGFDRSS